jgi:hypothetical protein
MNNPNKIQYQQHPAIFLLEQWQLYLNGLDRVITFYPNDSQPQSFEAMEWNRQYQHAYMPMALGDEMMPKLRELSAEKVAYQWLRPEHLPFIRQNHLSISQLDLFSEAQYLVLLIRSQVKQSCILSYLFFRNDCSNFGISDNSTQIETSHKAIIGNMASRFAEITLNNFQASKIKENAFRQQTKNILEARQLDVNKQQEEFSDWKKLWLDSYLLKLSERDGLNYVMSEKAEEFILTSNASYDRIKSAIDNCIDYICNLLPYTPGDELIIEQAYISLPSVPRAEVSTVKEQQPVSRQNKTMLLLDRLEEAADRLYQEGMPITSADVGASMLKPITAPAISDALRKNKVRILQLFEQYPQRWMTIRQYFKPVINLIAKNNQRLSISS